MRIYSYYPIINGNKTTFYRHPIYKFSFIALNGKEKWTAYKFIKNVYNKWILTHLKRIYSIINNLPLDPDFKVLKQFKLRESGLLQGLKSYYLFN
jgi:hypothetical protein